MGADDRPPQGARLPPRARPPGVAGGGDRELATGDGAPRTAAPQRDETLWEAVRELPARQRSAVVLRFLADLPHRDIAAAIGCSEEAARRSLHEGLSKLAERWCQHERRSTSSNCRRRALARARHAAARCEPPRPRRPRRLSERIAEEGLADISYAPVDSPFGTLHAAATRRGLVRLAFPEERADAVLERLARQLSPRIVERRAAGPGASASSTSTSPGAGASSSWRSTGP